MKKKLEILTPQGFEKGDRPQKMVLETRTACIRCGNCCKGGGPVLLKGDLSIFMSGTLSHDNTYTVRAGEPIITYGDNEIFESPLELIKIKGKEGSAECIFHSGDEVCSIYENRPSQCRAYKCWSPGDVLTGLEKERLDRREIFASVDVLLDIIGKHEEKCSYRKVSDAFEKLSKGDEETIEEIMDMLQYDTYIRPFLEEKLKIPATAMDLILGKPLIDTINAFGFRIEIKGDEYILLPIHEKGEE